MEFIVWLALVYFAIKGLITLYFFSFWLALGVLIFASPVLPLVGIIQLFR